jgi:predicted Zn-dependent peptidase
VVQARCGWWSGLGGRLDGDALGAVERLLGDLEAAQTPAPEAVQLNGDGGPNVTIHHKDSDQAHLCLGVRSYPLVHPDRYALQMLRRFLGTGMSSRLFTEVRERRGLAYYVFAANQSYTTPARSTPRPESTSRASTRR